MNCDQLLAELADALDECLTAEDPSPCPWCHQPDDKHMAVCRIGKARKRLAEMDEKGTPE